jgi:uncharacterized protein
MSIFKTVGKEIVTAMRAKDKERLGALRDIKSQFMLEMTRAGAAGDDLDDSVALKILTKLHKQRSDTAQLYAEQGRTDLEAEERSQAAVIEGFLPTRLTDEEVESRVAQIITDSGANSMADMGKVMGLASKEMAGQADGKAISAMVRAKLS